MLSKSTEWKITPWQRICDWLFQSDPLRRALLWRNLDGDGHDWRYEVYIYLAVQAYHCDFVREERAS